MWMTKIGSLGKYNLNKQFFIKYDWFWQTVRYLGYEMSAVC